MSFKKKLLSTAMAVAMTSGFAISQNASAVELAENGIGQLLLAPYYTTLNGYQTNFAIYNTREDAAVKVKIVVRSYGHSQEARDFLCYLTPGDVCRFELISQKEETTLADGSKKMVDVAYLTSTDDSVRNNLGGWAYDPDVAAKGQAQTPLKIILDDSKMLAVDKFDINEVGHVEAIGVYSVKTGTYKVNGEDVKVTRGMKKGDLAKIFDIYTGITADQSVWDAIASGTISSPVMGASSNANISSLGALLDISGSVTVEKKENGQIVDRMGYRIPALTGGVVTNPRFDIGVGPETPIGKNFAANGDTTIAIEQALATTKLSAIYESKSTAVIVTFPTKYLHRGIGVCNGINPANGIDYTPPFDREGKVPYSLVVFDNHENRKAETIFFSPSANPYFAAEVNYFMPNWFADSGYFTLSLNPSAKCVNAISATLYEGAPTLAFTHKFALDGTNNPIRSILEPTAHQ